MKQIYYSIYDLHNADWWPFKTCATQTLISRGLLDYTGSVNGKVLIPKQAVDDFFEFYKNVKKNWVTLPELLKTMGKKRYKRLTEKGTIQKVEIGGKVYCLLGENNK